MGFEREPLSMDVLQQIAELFDRHGESTFSGLRVEPVSALAHALQCAQLAEWTQAPDELVVAALLHDIGHFIAPASGKDAIDDVHELRALSLLAHDFGPAVIEPVRLYVQAKRYLVARDAGYAATLSGASAHTLALQGGPMSPDEVRLFESLPYASQAVALRRWDDLAKQPGRRTPGLNYYLGLADALRRKPVRDPRCAVGATDIA